MNELRFVLAEDQSAIVAFIGDDEMFSMAPEQAMLAGKSLYELGRDLLMPPGFPRPKPLPGPVFPWRLVAPPPRLALRYKGADGKISDRIVQPQTVEGTDPPGKRETPERLVAYCELARAPRTLNISGVLSASDAETGEVIPDLADYLMGRAPRQVG